MKKILLLPAALVAAGMLGLGTGCVVEPGPVGVGVDVDADPPPVQSEVVVTSPGPDYVWIGGSWVWTDHWVWEPGRWQHPPHAGAVWVASRYENHGGHRVFVRGRWR